MPIYEYSCRDCGTEFEELIVRKPDEIEIRCPECRGDRVVRLISRPSPCGRGGGTDPGGCAPSG